MPVLKRKSRRYILAFLLSGILAQPFNATAGAKPTLEYVVKANYLFKFTPFVEWPPDVFSQPGAPLVICVAGKDPFAGALDDAVRGQTFEGRAVVVRRIATVEAGASCHVLFVGQLTGQSQDNALKMVAGRPILTVTEGRQSNDGGIIQFVMEDGRVRFDIDEAAARAARLNISSKLLGLAVSHRRTAP